MHRALLLALLAAAPGWAASLTDGLKQAGEQLSAGQFDAARDAYNKLLDELPKDQLPK